MSARTPASVWVARAVLVAAVLLALGAGVPEGYHPSVFLVVGVALAATWSAFRPEHLVLSLTLGVVVVWWSVRVGHAMPVAVLVAAGGVVVAHVTATVLSYGPPRLPVDGRVAVLWGSRAAVVWLASAVVWGVARAYSGHPTPAVFWLAGLAAALVGSVTAGLAMPYDEERDGKRPFARPLVRPVVRRGGFRR